eukprot:TRINITY_DN392_c0_g1_i1.p1 TRINITY_DN392_c0_g1~~TRINITY_DN392_c0_g1_i1.p1  ORF type:complete len:150 (-),score=40.15 TRINITY_DN392_c0_g1_i1:130-579(-)
MLGPGLALRGAEGSKSLDKSITVLQFQSKLTLVFFMFCLLFFHLSSILLLLINFKGTSRLLVSIMLLAFTSLYFLKGREIFRNLFVSDTEAVTGKFTGFSGYDKMADLERIGHDRKLQSVRESPRVPELQSTPTALEQGVFATIRDMFT